MKKVLSVLVVILLAQSLCIAQLFTNYSIGLSALAERGIATYDKNFYHYSTPMVYGSNLLLMTENKKERLFINIGIGFTNYSRNDFFRTPPNPNLFSPAQILPNVSLSYEYSITHLNIPISVGYKFIRYNRFYAYASAGVDLRFLIASRLVYTIKDSTEKIIFERTTTDLSYLNKVQLFTFALGFEYNSASGKFAYRLEPFFKIDSRKYFEGEAGRIYLNEFLYSAGLQISCFYKFKLRN